jgi:hypothetical protein
MSSTISNLMKVRHAPAVVIVGWLLVIPQIYHQNNKWSLSQLNNKNAADYSGWNIVGKYDSEAGCKQAIKGLIPQTPDSSILATHPEIAADQKGFQDIENKARNNAHCVAADKLEPN